MTMERNQKLNLQKTVSKVIIILGMALLTYGVIVEDEPTAIPLLMIVSGTVWYFIIKSRTKTHKK